MSDRLAVVGVLAAAAGTVLVAVPGGGTDVVPRIAATLLAICVCLVAAGVGVRAMLADGEPPLSLPTPESRPGYPTPGQDLATLLSEVGLVGRRHVAEGDGSDGGVVAPRGRLRARLRTLAVELLARTEGTPHETAAERLSDGSWTDDDVAAAFFAGERPPPLARWTYLPGFRTELPVVRRARHAVAALAARVGDSPDPETRLSGTATDDSTWPTETLPRHRSTGRTRRVVAAVLLASAVGVGFGYPGAVLTATLGVALAGAARIWVPEPDLTLRRSVSTERPAPGEAVTVTVTVENTGSTTLPDVRLLDGVPCGLAVTDGSPRVGTALRPNRSATVSYTVTAVPGRHTFEPGLAVVGDVAGATETLVAVEAVAGQTVIDCGFDRPDRRPAPVWPQATVDPGPRDGDTSGAGVEFEAVREYRPGDPPSRIDWHHRAKTGQLSTVEFREPRLVRVVLLLDTRPGAYVAPTPEAVPAPRVGARGAYTLAARLLEDGVPVGVATTVGDCWTPPRGGTEQRRVLRDLLAGSKSVPWRPPTETPPVEDVVDGLRARIDRNVRIWFLSPLCDDGAVELARRLDVAGHEVTVLSPDPTDATTVEGAYGRLARRQRCARLRELDVPVTDWGGCDDLEGVTSVEHA